MNNVKRILIYLFAAFALSAVYTTAEAAEKVWVADRSEAMGYLIEGKCYSSAAMQMYVMQKSDAKHYAMVGLNTPPSWPKVHFLTTKKYQMNTNGLINMQIRFIKDFKYKAATGFETVGRQWEECS